MSRNERYRCSHCPAYVDHARWCGSHAIASFINLLLSCSGITHTHVFVKFDANKSVHGISSDRMTFEAFHL